jgi:hypothetical protein
MGYRSEVYIAVPKKAEKEIDTIMNEHKLLQEDAFGDKPFNKYDHKQTYTQFNADGKWFEKSRKLVIYEGNWLKWYEEYDDVQGITGIVEKYEPSGSCMVCVGEDGAIHSHMGEYHDVFNVYVKVELA